MYFCGDCKKQFQGGRRIDSTTLWQSYLTEKRTVKELSVMHKCSERTIRRKLKLVAESFNPSFPKEATVIIDTTYFSRTFGVMLFQDATSGKILYRKFVKNETNKEYLLQAITSCPVQMCQFHQLQIIRRLLTNNPHLPASIELLALARKMFTIGKEKFLMEFGKWCARWEDFLNERTTLISGKTTYTHRRLRTAKRSLKTHLKWLFTYEEHTEVNIPNTTNMLEGYNSQLKRALLNHNGLSDTNKKKFIDGFLNITK